MKKSLVITFVVLLFLTLTTALLSAQRIASQGLVFAILAISAIKFMLVTYQFMDLKKAHSFWKTSVLVTLGLLVLVLLVLKK